MEAITLIPKAKDLPNLDAAPLLRELFQDEFEAAVPTQKLSQNILTSLKSRKESEEDIKTFKSVEFLENFTNRRDSIIEFTENILEAHKNHEEKLQEISRAEKHVFETHAHFLQREAIILENRAIRDLLILKRQPLFKSLDVNYVRKYKLLQGEAGLPLEYELKSDFRVQNFKKWKKRLESISQDSLIMEYINLRPPSPGRCNKNLPRKGIVYKQPPNVKKFQKSKPKKKTEKVEILKATPGVVFFTDFKLGDIYVAEIRVKNTHSKKVHYQLKPMNMNGPFRVNLNDETTTTAFPGLSFSLTVEFTPKSLDNAAEDIIINTDDGNRFLIPLIAYLEPPVLKSKSPFYPPHLQRFCYQLTRLLVVSSEKIMSSYIECGACFTGDSKVVKLKFRCYRGSGEFFIMSSDDWNRSYINTVTNDNLLEIPPFRVYPVYFKMEKDEVIDLFVEFMPKNSGMHIENIVIACDNGQIKTLDLIGDAVGWHSYYFTFQDSLLKELPVEADDDIKVKNYIDFKDVAATGKVEKVFCVSNNSNMSFEFQWKIREANIVSQQKYLKLNRYQVKIDPENGTFEPNSIWEFLVTITFDNADIGNYRMVLSLYVLNLPYQSIEEDDTVIQPTGFVRNLYSQSLYGEEEGSAVSPELASLQGTYESLQESIKSYVEYQNKAQAVSKVDFCKNICIPNPALCAKPLKKSKTFFNIGGTRDEVDGLVCVCRHKPEVDSNSESCISNVKEERTNETPPQRNEVIWDFVDILVDEIELWVEVVPTRITLEPSIVHFSEPLKINGDPIFKKVRIINHNRSAVNCLWLFPSETDSTKKPPSVCLAYLYDKKADVLNQDSRSSKEQTRLKPELKTSDNTTENKPSDQLKIIVSPQETFVVDGLSEFICEIGISAYQPGNIEEMLCLSVNDGDLNLNLMILGRAVIRSLRVSPDIIDFGVLRQGSRYLKNFTIVNKGPDALAWKVNEFKFDFYKEDFCDVLGVEVMEHTKRSHGIIKKHGNSTTESCCVDARKPGIRYSILEIEDNKLKHSESEKQYILVLGDVKLPRLSLSAPRFENAILAPSGMMHVGQKIQTKVTLTNIGPVETFFTWGHSFGCHCQKIKVEISPKSSRIQNKKKLTVDVELTPLEEGIISHCYIPCFFCRSLEPLILSIVAVIENLNVTFEIIDYPMQTHADTRTFLKSPFYHTVLRIPWPIKIFNPTLSLKYINETDARSIMCHCLEVEEEALRAFGESKRLLGSVPELQNKLTLSEKTTQSLQSLEASYESLQSSPMKNLSSNSSKVIPEDDLKMSNTIISGSSASESKKSLDNPVVVYTYAESASDVLSLSKPQLEFLNVPYQTPILRQFAIRNETPIETNFKISVSNFGVVENLPERRFEKIKNRVFSCTPVDEFQDKLADKQPLVIVVEPSHGELKGYDAVCINVYCYGNTWGEYRDELICQVKGIENYHLKMLIQIVGHPIYFPMFTNEMSSKPILRFQSVTLTEKTPTKQIKVINRSAVPLNVSWLVFLKKPLLVEEEREDSFNLCVDSNFESNHSVEESTQSSKNYIPKNASDNGSIFPSSKDLSQNSDPVKSLPKVDSTSSSLVSMRKDKGELGECEKKISLAGFSEDTKSEFQQFLLPGRQDNNVFKVEPKEMNFDPYEEKKISITFDPQFSKPEEYPQEYLAVLTCCVKLTPEDEKCPGLYFRPCGINFVSELMDFSAVVELPLVSFDLLKGDLKFFVDANAVIKSKAKKVKILRKFLIKNKNEKSLSLTIETSTGTVFKVKAVNLLDKYYPAYNPKIHNLKVEPGHLLEMELECSVTYKDIQYAYEELKRERKKHLEEISPDSPNLNKPNDKEEELPTKKEPWMRCIEGTFKQKIPTGKNLNPRDSFEINLNRMSPKSGNSVCFENINPQDSFNAESLGEYFELPKVQQKLKKPLKHVTTLAEDIYFVQSRLATQTLSAELHISFPAVKVSPKSVDFGNIYLGESAVRYCSVVNLTGFPTDFRVVAKINSPQFKADPLTGKLPAADYNSEIGRSIKIDFKPSEPGYFQEIYHIFCNADLEFDFYELFVSGLGTWNEKYKSPKFDTFTKLEGVYPQLQK